MDRNIVPCLKQGTCLAESVMAWGPGTGGAAASDSENPTILIVQCYGYQSKTHVCLLCDVLERHCVPLCHIV